MAAANAPATATATGNAPAAITLLPPQPGSRRTRHPQADLIREKVLFDSFRSSQIIANTSQIDWYFSNENLKKDQLILNCINAKGPNSAVNIYRVAGRLKKVCESKISDWQVIDACRGSKMVDVVDKNHIRRKVPYVVDDSDEDDGIWGEEDKRPRLKPIPAHPGIKVGTFVVHFTLVLWGLMVTDSITEEHSYRLRGEVHRCAHDAEGVRGGV